MGFKTVSDLSTDNAIALGGFNKKTRQDNPTTITGYYLGSKDVDSPMSKTGKAKLHIFQTSGGNTGVWGKTDLDRKMGSAQVGALTRVTFDGLLEIKGKNPMYKYKVEVDTENTIDVAPPAATSDDSYEEPSYDEPTDSEDDVDQAPTYVAPKAPAVGARAPSAEQQARVQALLGKRK